MISKLLLARKAEEGNLRVAKDQLKLLVVGNVSKDRMFSLIRISKAQFKPILSLIQIQILSVEMDLMKELLQKHSKAIDNSQECPLVNAKTAKNASARSKIVLISKPNVFQIKSKEKAF